MVIRIITHLLRFLVGGVFIYSAIVKLFPAEPFELFIFGQSFFGWDFATILARLIIALELGLGVILVVNIYSKRIIQLILALLVAFTIYLAYLAIFQKDVTNCNCFGAHIEISPVESIIKNVLLIIASLFLLFKNSSFTFRFKKVVLIIAILGSLALPFILSPPDMFISSAQKHVEYPFDFDKLGEFNYEGVDCNLKEGKAIVAFLSMGCKFCRRAAQKLTIIDNKSEKDLPIYYVVFGRPKNMEVFLEESESKMFPYKIFENDTFFILGGRKIPSIQFLEDGIVVDNIDYRRLDEDVINGFIDE